MHLCVGCEAADYPQKVLIFDDSACTVWKAVWGIPTNNLGPLKAHMLALHISVGQGKD